MKTLSGTLGLVNTTVTYPISTLILGTLTRHITSHIYIKSKSKLRLNS